MNTRTLKLLSATTAFAALASAPHAATILVDGPSATPYTSSTVSEGTSDIINVSGSTVISVTAAPAIYISGTTASTLNTSASSIIRSSSVTGTVSLGLDSALTGVTINNSGSIINTIAAGSAISMTAVNADSDAVAAVINNTGTISGSINFSDAATGNALTNTGGTISGNIVGGTGVETITLTGGSYTGAINLGAGANVLAASGTTITGSYTGGGDNDTVTLTNTSVTGVVDLGNGGTNNLTINGQNTFTTQAGISNVSTLAVNDVTANLNHTLTSVAAITGNTASTLNFNGAQTITGALTNNGTANLTSGTVQAATYVAGSGSNLGISIVSNTGASTSNGKLVLTGGGADLSTTSLTVTIGSSAGYIASGTTYTLVDGGGASQLQGTLLASNTGVYRLNTELDGNDVVLTVGRVSTSSVVGSNTNNQTIANALDVLGASSTGSLLTVQNLIGQQSTAAGVASLVESLAPAIDGVGAASVGVTQATGNQVSNRLASLRGKSVATGDAISANHMWVEGYGSKAEQDDNDGKRGYDATGGGVTFGVDTDTLVEGFTTGASFSYGQATVDSNASGNGSTDVDTYVATVYGSRVLDQGIFVNAQAGLGFNQYESERTVSGLGTAKGEFDGLQGTAKVEAGKDYSCDAWTFTPLASAQYTYLNLDSYTETGIGNAGLTVNPDDLHALDLGLGAQVAYTMPLASGGTLKPNVRAKYIYSAGDRELATTSRFVGGGTSFNTTGVEADASSINLGAGLLLTTVAGADFSVNYDADLRSSMTGHAGQLKARWAF